MKVLLNVDESALIRIGEQAVLEGRSRKKFMERLLNNFSLPVGVPIEKYKEPESKARIIVERDGGEINAAPENLTQTADKIAAYEKELTELGAGSLATQRRRFIEKAIKELKNNNK